MNSEYAVYIIWMYVCMYVCFVERKVVFECRYVDLVLLRYATLCYVVEVGLCLWCIVSY